MLKGSVSFFKTANLFQIQQSHPRQETCIGRTNKNMMVTQQMNKPNKPLRSSSKSCRKLRWYFKLFPFSEGFLTTDSIWFYNFDCAFLLFMCRKKIIWFCELFLHITFVFASHISKGIVVNIRDSQSTNSPRELSYMIVKTVRVRPNDWSFG